jgi:hypothetical protein
MSVQDGITINDAHKIAALEKGVSVTAGSLNTTAFYRRVERQRAMSRAEGSALTTVFGRFLNMARRNLSLTLEQLAEQIDTDPLELLRVEEGLVAARASRCFKISTDTARGSWTSDAACRTCSHAGQKGRVSSICVRRAIQFKAVRAGGT